MQLHSLPYTYIVRHLRNTSTFMYCGTLLYISHETSFSFVCCGMSTCLLQCRFTSVYVSIIRACTKGQFRTNSFISECQLLVLFIRLSLFFAGREHTIYLLVYIHPYVDNDWILQIYLLCTIRAPTMDSV